MLDRGPEHGDAVADDIWPHNGAASITRFPYDIRAQRLAPVRKLPRCGSATHRLYEAGWLQLTGGVSGQALADAFPWVDFLPEPEREAFAAELTQMMIATSAVDNYTPLVQLVREWRATAEIHADPELARRLAAPIDDPTGGLVLFPDPTGH